MFEEGFPDLQPLSFFQLSFKCHEISQKEIEKKIKQAKYKIPSSNFITQEEGFADLYMGWSLEGLAFFADVKVDEVEAFFPEVIRGDSIELFIDTRDVKTSGFNTRFCHHFFFLPEAYEGHSLGEITKFRTEDAHELCNPNDLKLSSRVNKNGYQLQIFIPAECLQGYDPKEKDRFGFSYRVNRKGGPPQHFSALTQEFQIEQQPSLWSSARMVK